MRGEDVKAKDALIRGAVMVLAISGSGAFADPPGKEDGAVMFSDIAFRKSEERDCRQTCRAERIGAWNPRS